MAEDMLSGLSHTGFNKNGNRNIVKADKKLDDIKRQMKLLSVTPTVHAASPRTAANLSRLGAHLELYKRKLM